MKYPETEDDEDNEDLIKSDFLKDFGINLFDYDEDFVDCIYKEQPTNLFSLLLKNCSYSEQVIPNFIQQYSTLDMECNSAILIYEYKYNPINKKNPNALVSYIGTITINIP